MATRKETCLGVFSLETGSWIIASVQLLFNFFFIIGDIVKLQTSISQDDMTAAFFTSFTLVWSVVADGAAIYAALLLSIGNTL